MRADQIITLLAILAALLFIILSITGLSRRTDTKQNLEKSTKFLIVGYLAAMITVAAAHSYVKKHPSTAFREYTHSFDEYWGSNWHGSDLPANAKDTGYFADPNLSDSNYYVIMESSDSSKPERAIFHPMGHSDTKGRVTNPNDIKLKVVQAKKISKDIVKITYHNQTGSFDFYLQDSMIVNTSYVGFLIISKSLPQGEKDKIIGSIFPNPSKLFDTVGMASVSQNMIATLNDAGVGNFKVTRNDIDSFKTFSDKKNAYLTWEWIITPLQSGDNFLNLKLYTLNDNRSQGSDLIPAKLIKIRVNARNLLDRASDFVSRYWLLITMFGAIVVFYFNYIRPKPGEKATKA